MKLFPAGAPELVRTNQKDRFYTDHLTSLLSEVSRHVLPLRLWLRWQREFQLLAELSYYGLTTVLGNQTLGEEYCNIVQVAPSTADGPFVAPGFLRRTVPIIMQTLGVYAIEKGLEITYKKIRERSLGSIEISEQNYEKLEKIVETVEDIFSGASRLHLALFYVYGIFYHFGKRLSAIRYLMIRYTTPGTMNLSPMTTYRMLGWMIVLQIVMKVFKWCTNMLRKNEKCSHEEHAGLGEDNELEGGRVILQASIVESRVRCPSCLEDCRHPTAALCGHIFCWSCISEWTSEKMECPVCRTTVKPHQIICLQHFKS